MPNTEEILPDRFPIAIERKVLRSVSSVFTDIVWSVDISTHPYEKSAILAHLCKYGEKSSRGQEKRSVALPSVTAFVKNWNWKKKKKKNWERLIFKNFLSERVFWRGKKTTTTKKKDGKYGHILYFLTKEVVFCCVKLWTLLQLEFWTKIAVQYMATAFNHNPKVWPLIPTLSRILSFQHIVLSSWVRFSVVMISNLL